MSRDSNVLSFRQPDTIDDPLNELAREGARRMLAQALIAEADAFVAQLKDLKLPDGRGEVLNLLGNWWGASFGCESANGLWRARQRSTPWRRDYPLRSALVKS